MTLKRLKELIRKAIYIIKYQGLVEFNLHVKIALFKLIGQKNNFLLIHKKDDQDVTTYNKFVDNKINSVPALFDKKFKNLQPIRFIKVNRSEIRFNMVTDSIQKDSLFGGVATALILSTLYANRYNVILRIISRTGFNSPKNYFDFLNLFKIPKPNKVEFYSDFNRDNESNSFNLEVSDNDIFLSTSWWTTHTISQVNLRSKMFYLLQEVESFFYPNGDEQYLCKEMLEKNDILYIINSKILYEYYKLQRNKNVTDNCICFEPSFPDNIFSPGDQSFIKKDKYRLFFYSRPGNPRNLFYTGLNILEEGCKAGLINKDKWEIFFAGSDVPKIYFYNGIIPVNLGHLKWKDYLDFIKTVDLGLCLMYTPHPSYPPLDIISSGGVVLTNKYMNKETLDYSKNIICKKLSFDDMLIGIEEGVMLAQNNLMRKENYYNNIVNKSWDKSFSDILEYINKNQ